MERTDGDMSRQRGPIPELADLDDEQQTALLLLFQAETLTDLEMAYAICTVLEVGAVAVAVAESPEWVLEEIVSIGSVYRRRARELIARAA